MTRPLLLALPGIMATIGLAVVVAVERVDPDAFVSDRPLNAAEAAAAGDAAEVLRRLRFGEDPTRVEPLRPGIASSGVQRATTLEAAMWSRELEMIQMLDRHGAIVEPQTRRHLACLASDLDLADIARYLAADVAHCEGDHALQHVIERTTGQHE